MPQITSPPTPINRRAILVAREFMGANPAAAGAQPSAAAADHLHSMGTIQRVVTGFGLAQGIYSQNGGSNPQQCGLVTDVGAMPSLSTWTVEYWSYSGAAAVGFWNQGTGATTPNPTGTNVPEVGFAWQIGVNPYFTAFGTSIGDIGAPAGWAHVAMTYDGRYIRTFTNGVLQQTLASSGAQIPSGMLFGAQAGGNGTYVDEIRVSNVARYTADFTPPGEPFTPDSDTVLLWHLDDTPLGPWANYYNGIGGGGGGPSYPNGLLIPAGWYWTPEVTEDASGNGLWGGFMQYMEGLGIFGATNAINCQIAKISAEDGISRGLNVSSLENQTGDINLITPTGGSAVSAITQNADGTTSLTLAPGALDSTYEQTLTVTTPVTVLSYTPAENGLFLIAIYFRVVTGTTEVTVEATTTDAGGAQTFVLLAQTPKAIGSYTIAPIVVACAAGKPISIVVTAGTANQVYVSASVLEN